MYGKFNGVSYAKRLLKRVKQCRQFSTGCYEEIKKKREIGRWPVRFPVTIPLKNKTSIFLYVLFKRLLKREPLFP